VIQAAVGGRSRRNVKCGGEACHIETGVMHRGTRLTKRRQRGNRQAGGENAVTQGV
jgi:hypothetical protein